MYLFLLIIMIAALFGYGSEYFYMSDHIFYACLLLFMSVGVLWKSLAFHIELRIHKVDILLFCIAVYVCIIDFINSSLYFSLARVLCLSALYVYMKCNLVKRSRVIITMLIVGGVQSIVCILQLFGWIGSDNVYYAVSGSLGNPALSSLCVLFGMLSLLYYFDVYNKRRRFLSLCIVLFVIHLFALFLLNCRGATLSFIVAIALYFFRNVSFTRMAILWLCVVAITVFLYCCKMESANARLFIWLVSIRLVVDNFLFGGGACAFSRHYMECQADYFNVYPDSTFVSIADNVVYPYSEALQLIISYGMVGMLFVVLLICYLWKMGVDRFDMVFGVSWSFFALTSYPASFVVLLLPVFMIVFSCCASLKGGLLLSRYVLHIFGGVFLVGAVYYLIGIYQVVRSVECDDYSKETYLLASQSDILNDYLLTKHIVQNKLDESNFYYFFPSSELYCSMAEVYIRKGKYSEAEIMLLLASRMVPTRVAPKFLLMQLYEKMGLLDKRRSVACDIVDMPVKIDNTLSLRAKKQAYDILKE